MQDRPPQQARSRGGRGPGHGGRGRGRGGGGRPGPPLGGARVPNINQVIAGAHVSIVLKVDQPTGHQVQGTVSEVLTRGNHPRGIKVRLVDGRVGRVQRLATEAEARDGSQGLSNLGRNGEPNQGFGSNRVSTSNGSRFQIRYRDVREEDELNAPPSGYSLGDLLPPGHPLREDSRESSNDRESFESPDLNSAVQVCPVCHQFEGDEIAVAHHVNSHFED
ncbi:hypothetical protein HDK90DRAFT_36424 [Phyllosticta capitalensis]|uniref:UBZ4-type domain-containing protein n=1 Tax=Phyllosticta capitalensis TaxID=121624 RepID=A0ABR1Z4U4_9PEZI